MCAIWEINHLNKSDERIFRRCYSSQMLEYLIHLSPTQICFPKRLFNPQAKNQAVVDSPEEKTNEYAFDKTYINKANVQLAPETIQFLKDISSRRHTEEDQSNYYIT